MNLLRDAAISFPMFGEDFSINPPASFTLFGHTFYFYGAIIALGFLLAVWYCCRRCRQFGITPDDIIDMLILALPLAIVGARLYYCLTYKNSDGVNPYFQDPVTILYIWEGGLAIYGGIIGAVIGVILTCRRKHISIGAMLDVGAFGLLIGQAIGRWGNFMNREAFGWTENVDQVFCRMGLTLPGQETFYVHPTFLYESLWNALGLLLLHLFSKKCTRKYDGQIFILYIGWYGLGRAFIEGLRTDSLWLIPDVLRISQGVAILSVLAAIILLWVNGRVKHDPAKLWVNVVAARQAEAEAEAAAAEESTPAKEAADTASDPAADDTPEQKQ